MGASPGYAQSLLKENQLVFDWLAYSGLTRCQYGSTLATDREQFLNLSSGYAKSSSPAAFPTDSKDLHASGSSIHPGGDTSGESGHGAAQLSRQRSVGGPMKEKPRGAKRSPKVVRGGRVGECNSLGRQANREASVLCVPAGEFHPTPGSLSDLRLSVDNVRSSPSQRKMPSSLSLQTELPLQRERKKASLNGGRPQPEGRRPSATREDLSEAIFRRTISVGSEALSEAFFSADEEQVASLSGRQFRICPASPCVS